MVMDDGRVAEHGARSELAADPSSRYAQLLSTARGTTALDEVLQ